MKNKRCIVTGGCGFIGSALVRRLVRNEGATVLVVDKLTYAGVPESLKEAGLDPVHLPQPGVLTLSPSLPLTLFIADICDQEAMDRAFEAFKPDTIFHLAAESHVDRSIDGPGEFVRTNVVGTATLLQAALKYWKGLETGDERRERFCFQHISTDEVYGTLGETGFSPKGRPIPRIRPIRPPRPRRTIWSAPGMIRTGCRFGSPTAPTTTVPTTSPRS